MLTLICWIASASAAEKTAEVESVGVSPVVAKFIENRCIACHGPDEQNASLRFDTMPETIANEATAQRWQDILDVLNLDQMPPEEAEQPSIDELTKVLEALTKNLSEARQRMVDTEGQIVLRRMNRREYKQTIAALFGVPVEVDLLPDDNKVDGFDTLGQAHSFSSLHLERYLDLGRRVLDRALPEDHRPRREVDHHQEAERASDEVEKQIHWLEKKRDRHIEQIKEGRSRLEVVRDINTLEIELSRDYLQRSETQTGCLIPFRGLNPTTHVTFDKGQHFGLYKIRVRCGAASDRPVDELYLKVIRGEYRSTVPDAVDYYQATGTVDEPQTIEFVVELDDGMRSNRFAFERRHDKYQRLSQYMEARDYFFKYPDVAYLLEDQQADLWIDWIEMEGPLERPPPPLSRERLFGGEQPEALDESEIRKRITAFAREAFRKVEPEPEYVDRLMALYDQARQHGDSVEEALKQALVVVLASPRFLYLYEPQPEEEEQRPLTDRELAVRLSYFLWSAPPDAELYRVVQEGHLRDPKVLAQQVDRMLTADRSTLFVETFLTQWLELERLDQIDPASTGVPAFDEAVHGHSKQEVYAFFDTLLQGDLPATNLIDSEFAVLNGIMADFYGIAGVSGEAFRKVELPGDSVRGGLLGQSAILTLTGTGERTSPVERGVFVLRKLLDRPPPPAPANVPMLDEEAVGTRSIRETLATHMTKAQCQSCHRRIDPLGFALENFDPVGQWRTSVVSTDGSTTFAIETAGTMPDGKRDFADYAELKARLSEDGEAMVTGLTKALMTYALGRTISFRDRETVEQIVADSAGEGYGLRSLVHRVIQSKPFLSK